MWSINPGEANGNLTLRFKGAMAAEDVLRFHPEIQAQLDEIVNQGWKYLFIQGMGTAISDVVVENLPCRLKLTMFVGTMHIPAPPTLEVTFRQEAPELKEIPDVQEFRINVCSKNFPRAATVDLVKKVVTYLHDPFWKWNKSWATDGKKLSEAREVYEIATWLIDQKRFRLVEAFEVSRYQELASQFKSMPK